MAAKAESDWPAYRDEVEASDGMDLASYDRRRKMWIVASSASSTVEATRRAGTGDIEDEMGAWLLDGLWASIVGVV